MGETTDSGQDNHSEEMKRALAEFILHGDQSRMKSEMRRITNGMLSEIHDQIAREREEQSKQPPKTYEEVCNEYHEILMIESAEAVVKLRAELEKWAQDVIDMFVDPQIYDWDRAYGDNPGAKVDKQSIRLRLAEELNAAIVRKLKETLLVDNES